MPTEEIFLQICLLTAMEGELKSIKDSLLTLFTNNQLSSAVILSRLELQQQEIDRESFSSHTPDVEVAAVAQTSG